MRLHLIIPIVIVASLAIGHSAIANSPMLCRDGTQSPTCKTSDASKQGCCSGHGGVDDNQGCGSDDSVE